MRKFFADTIAMVLFSIAIGMCIELGIAQMTLAQSLRSRGMSIPLNILTGGLNGWYCDWWVTTVFRVKPGMRIRLAMAEIVAFATFQIPIYICVLLVSGANWQQILVACSSTIPIIVVMGKPYGWMLRCTRWMCGVPMQKSSTPVE